MAAIAAVMPARRLSAERIPAGEPEPDRDDDESDRDDEHQADEPIELLLQWRAASLFGRQAAGDPADLRAGAGGDDDPLAPCRRPRSSPSTPSTGDPPPRLPAASGSTLIVSGMDSPVRTLRSRTRRSARIRRRSAGTTSPTCRSTTSPGTRSAAARSTTRPSRRTWACGAEASRSAWRAARLGTRWRRPRRQAGTSPARISRPSRTSPMTAAAMPATRSSSTNGCVAERSTNRQTFGGSGADSSFGPASAARSCASRLDSPIRGSTPAVAATAPAASAWATSRVDPDVASPGAICPTRVARHDRLLVQVAGDLARPVEDVVPGPEVAVWQRASSWRRAAPAGSDPARSADPGRPGGPWRPSSSRRRRRRPAPPADAMDSPTGRWRTGRPVASRDRRRAGRRRPAPAPATDRRRRPSRG